MTKENKLALVVGFGLVLLVGILISDHFSTARKQAAAELVQVSDPLVLRDRQNEPQLLDFQPPAPPVQEQPPPVVQMGDPNVYASQVLVDPQTLPLQPQQLEPRTQNPPLTASREQQVVNVLGGVPQSSADVQWVDIGVDANGNRVLRPVSPPTRTAPPASNGTVLQPGEKSHVVAAGESMSSICAKYYNDRSLVKALAKHNNLSDPNLIKAGQVLRIPTLQTLSPGAAASAAGESQGKPAQAKKAADENRGQQKPKTYTIKAGDTLMAIASKLMGSASKWEELYEANKDVLPDADTVIVGTVIKIPQ